MAEVYYATDTWLNDSPVAIKILKPELAASPENQRKFYSEESSLRQMGGGHVIGVLSSVNRRYAGRSYGTLSWSTCTGVL